MNPPDLTGGGAAVQRGDQPRRTLPRTTRILARPGDGWRGRRLRKFARRRLDDLLGVVDPWDLAEPIDYRAAWMDRGVAERQQRGDELSAAGWTP